MTLVERLDAAIVTTIRGVAALAAGGAAALGLAASFGLFWACLLGAYWIEAAVSFVVLVASIWLVARVISTFPSWTGLIALEAGTALLALVWWGSRSFAIAY